MPEADRGGLRGLLLVPVFVAVLAVAAADFASDTFGKGGTFTFTPSKAGTIKYVCTIHPGMDGTITVEG